jgi:bifunctional DNase/RNase
MVEVKISALVRDKRTDSPVVLLQIPGTARHLPIWIGDNEASAIRMSLASESFERPLTHDLLKLVIDGLGGEVTRILITSLKGNTFYAKIFISREHEILAIDARPSDSIALALRTDSPIFLSEELMEVQADNMIELDLDPVDHRSMVESLIRDVEKGGDSDDLLEDEISPDTEDEEEDED